MSHTVRERERERSIEGEKGVGAGGTGTRKEEAVRNQEGLAEGKQTVKMDKELNYKSKC